MWKWVGLGLIVLGCSCTSEKKTQEKVFPVTLAEAKMENIPITIEAIGNVFSLDSVEIRPQVGGIVLEAYVKQGAYVKKGDPLYLIDPRPYQASLEQAKGTLAKDVAALNIAQITLDRNKELVEKDYVAKLTYQQFEANVESAKGQVMVDKGALAIALLNLEWTKVTSPIDGKLSQFTVDPGNLVVANDTNALTTVLMITPADIRFNINQKDFFEVQKAMKEETLKFEVILPEDIEHPREGKIYFTDNTLSTSTGTILIKGTVDNQDEFLWPGEFIRVRLQLREEPNAILVPAQAVSIGQEGPFIYVYNEAESTVQYHKVVKGIKIKEQVQIHDGIKAGDKVVLKGQINLKPGSKVQVQK